MALPRSGLTGEYLTLIAAVQADQERQGREVVRARFSVSEMIDGLAARGLENTPDNRAAIAAIMSTTQ